MLKEDWYSGIGNSIQNLSQDAGEIHFSPLRNCYSLSATKPFRPGEKVGQPALLGGLLSKIKPHSTQQGERLMPALCPLISSWKEKLSLSSHPRVSAWFQRPLELLWASRGTRGNQEKKKSIAGYFFTTGEKSANLDQRASWPVYSQPQQIGFHHTKLEALWLLQVSTPCMCMQWGTLHRVWESKIKEAALSLITSRELWWSWGQGHSRFDFFFRLCAKGNSNAY